MKKLFSIIFIILSFSSLAESNYYFPTEVGTVLTYNFYDKKGHVIKDMSWMTYTVNKVETKKDATYIYFSVNWKDQDNHLKNMPAEYKSTFENLEIKIENGMMYMEFMNSLMTKLLMVPLSKEFSGSGMKITSTGDTKNIIPVNIHIGTILPEISMKMLIAMNMQGMDMNMVLNSRIYDAKVVAKEDITTPAGTFSCFKMTNKSEFLMDMGMAKQKDVSSSIQWLAKGIGFVKVEIYDMNNKLINTMILDKIERK